jgi:hypothetical protein
MRAKSMRPCELPLGMPSSGCRNLLNAGRRGVKAVGRPRRDEFSQSHVVKEGGIAVVAFLNFLGQPGVAEALWHASSGQYFRDSLSVLSRRHFVNWIW